MRRSLGILLLAASCAASGPKAAGRPAVPDVAPQPYPGGSSARGPSGLDFSHDTVGEPFQEGVASWYGGRYQGRKTANGELFDINMYTAAHRTLPLGTWVRVTNVETGAWVDVWVNDRGPYIDGRIIDLSEAAAKAIGITQKGLGNVRIDLLRQP